MTERVIALIPAFNEAARIGEVIRQARRHVSAVVVVDDGSGDDTAGAARAAGAHVIRHETNRGKGAAIRTALEHFARSDAVFAVFLDGDGQHDPSEIPALVDAARAGDAAVVVGTRMGDTAVMPLTRRLTNRFTSWVTGKLARQPIPDSQCGFRLLTRAVLADLNLAGGRYETETEMLIQAGRAGHRIRSVPVRTIYEGQPSKIQPLRDTLRFARLVTRYLR
jgi:glycosyltransferase involved in cell wall biosynthesis